MVFKLFRKNKNKDIEKGNDEKSKGFLGRLKDGLSRTRSSYNEGLSNLFVSGKLDKNKLEDLEEILVTSDMGIETSLSIVEKVSKNRSKIKDVESLKDFLKKEILEMVEFDKTDEISIKKPHIIMVTGVNGVGKTTTIGKLAAMYKNEGKKVLIAAADTFRAAAVEQLTIWAERAECEIVKHKENTDPAAVAFDGVSAAVARDIDIVLVDTAGRLQTQINLMEELKKIKRAMSKKIKGAPHETLMVIDATTGQNGLSQVKTFHESVGVSGIVLTKLDGTAKGGMAVSISKKMKIPLKYIGVGEQIDDLQKFDAEIFIDALF
ncbi:MAG: signal recognition particle-docking protein FtsY [Desulfobacterales bacterium]|nr:signal recognition particle-docking protein FtsY [Desulfobacterales bacterium]MCP4159474.1 signal recognition particle-docking protein FtsY [Deltaproteobacteria bacterium]